MVFSKLLAPSSSLAQVKSPKHVGSVPHIFSHIHKTYEVVSSSINWPNDSPPKLAILPEPSENKKSLKPKRKRAGDENADEYTLPVEARWVARAEVMNQKWVFWCAYTKSF